MITKFKLFENYDDVHHSKYLDLEKLKNGNLKIILTSKGKKEVEEEGIDDTNFDEYFEDIRCNSDYEYFINLDDAGLGMSDAPYITYGYNYDDDGNYTDEDNEENSDIYWYPNYMLTDFTKDLVENGYVVFDSGAKKTKEDIEEFRLNRITKKFNL